MCKNTPPSFYDTLELGEVKQIFNDQVGFLPVFPAGWHETSGVPLPHVFVPVCVCLICATTESPNFLHGKRLSKIELCRHAFARPFVEQQWWRIFTDKTVVALVSISRVVGSFVG